MKKYLVLDIGGSSIKYAMMNESAEFLSKDSVKTPLDCIESLVEIIGQIYDDYKFEIEGMAISMPGVLDPLLTRLIDSLPLLRHLNTLNISLHFDKHHLAIIQHDLL